MSRPKFRLLDLFCGGGGSSMGYHNAGFEVVGVDTVLQPNYPFEFYQADAMSFPLAGFDVIAASPPCQGYSQATSFHKGARDKHPRLIEALRERLQASGLPYVIENVPRAPLINPIVLCGTMFSLRTKRHRLFESNIPLVAAPHPDLCRKHLVKSAHPGSIPQEGEYWSIAGHFGQKDRAQREGLGIDWMKTTGEIANAIPPSYTEYIGKQIIVFLEKRGHYVTT